MNYNLLFIFVEGDDDEKFFLNVVSRKLKRRYNDVKFVKYARLKREKISNWLKSVKGMGADYYFITDINRAPCVTEKKRN